MDEYVWLANFPQLREDKLRKQHQDNVNLFVADLETIINLANLHKDEYLDYCIRDKHIYRHNFSQKLLNIDKYQLSMIPIQIYNKHRIYASICNPCFDEIIHRAYKVDGK